MCVNRVCLIGIIYICQNIRILQYINMCDGDINTDVRTCEYVEFENG